MVLRVGVHAAKHPGVVELAAHILTRDQITEQGLRKGDSVGAAQMICQFSDEASQLLPLRGSGIEGKG